MALKVSRQQQRRRHRARRARRRAARTRAISSALPAATAVARARACLVRAASGVLALFLPIRAINFVQIAITLGIVEGEVSNERKRQRNGEPMEHGTKSGHRWYNTDAYCNARRQCAGTKKTIEARRSKRSIPWISGGRSREMTVVAVGREVAGSNLRGVASAHFRRAR